MLDIKQITKENIEDFRNDFELPDDINDICDYYLVYDNDTSDGLAVFDIRKAPHAIKQMSIFYSNKFRDTSDYKCYLGSFIFNGLLKGLYFTFMASVFFIINRFDVLYIRTHF